MPATILNVDDDAGNRHFRRRVLEAAGIHVHDAATGTDALNRLKTAHVDLVLLDVGLPDISGFDVCRMIKADPAISRVYVLMVLAEFRSDEEWTRGLEMGADGYVHTPVEASVLVETVRALLRRQQAEARAHENWRVAEAGLRVSEQRWRSQFDHAPYGIFRASADGSFVLANRRLAKILGYPSAEDLLNLPISGLFQETDEGWPRLRKLWNMEGALPTEAAWRTRDNRVVSLLLHGRRVGPAEDAFEVFVEDMTDQRRLEEEFRQSQKMEAIGQLAGGIAHDFNNLLTAILGYTDMALDEAGSNDSLAADLREIKQAGQRAGTLTQQLLAFSRRQVLTLQPVDLNAVVGGMEQMLRRLIGEHIQVRWHPAPELPAINADAAQLEQVVLNLAVNARDAMPEGGRLSISTSVVHLPAQGVGGVPLTPGTYVRLGVSDSGHGMDAATQARIFEPFFTTKERGKGTGLGLSTVYGIVKQLTGYIFVESEVGRGTLFSLYFATADQPGSAAVAEAEASAPLLPAKETILVVEDEEVLRRLARSVLMREGYSVMDASGPGEALAISQNHLDSVDLILADVMMPGMRGWEMVDLLRPQQPRARVLYMSGYVDELETARDRIQPLISKPFKPRELLRTIRDILEGRSESKVVR